MAISKLELELFGLMRKDAGKVRGLGALRYALLEVDADPAVMAVLDREAKYAGADAKRSQDMYKEFMAEKAERMANRRR